MSTIKPENIISIEILKNSRLDAEEYYFEMFQKPSLLYGHVIEMNKHTCEIRLGNRRPPNPISKNHYAIHIFDPKHTPNTRQKLNADIDRMLQSFDINAHKINPKYEIPKNQH